MGALQKVNSGFRRTIILCVVIFWSPLAKIEDPPEPVAPIPALSRFYIDVGVPENGMLATVAHTALLVTVMPGVLVRVPVEVWSRNASSIMVELKKGAIGISVTKTQWYNKKLFAHLNMLAAASHVIVFGNFLLSCSRKPGAALIACVILVIGLIGFAIVLALNNVQPTPQFGAIMGAAVLEARACFNKHVAAIGEKKAAAGGQPQAGKAAQPAAASAAGGAKPGNKAAKSSKKAKKAD